VLLVLEVLMVPVLLVLEVLMVSRCWCSRC
jgi:hypothetical protein